jgi:type 1 fimbriae regulatory protein FimB/type 1 fimbriae regulatory protein FimE
VLLSFRHGFRVSEAVSLRWADIELKTGLMHVKRLKNGLPSTHPIQGDELRLLRRLERVSPFVFVSERGGPMADVTARQIVARLGRLAGIDWPVHFHSLRHGCATRLAQLGHDTRRVQLWMGHRNITHTTGYMGLVPDQFRDFWREAT